MQKCFADLFAGHLAPGLGFTSGFVFPFDATSHGIINHVGVLKPIVVIYDRLLTVII